MQQIQNVKARDKKWEEIIEKQDEKEKIFKKMQNEKAKMRIREDKASKKKRQELKDELLKTSLAKKEEILFKMHEKE